MIGPKKYFKECTIIGLSSASKLPSESSSSSDGNENKQHKKYKWSYQLKKIFSNGKEQMGVLKKFLIVSLGCRVTLFVVEFLKSLNEESQKGLIVVEAQAHICILISYTE